MNNKLNKQLLERLSFIQNKAKQVLITEYTDSMGFKYIDTDQFRGFRSAALSFLHSTLTDSHIYYTEFKRSTEVSGITELRSGIEILNSLREEIENGWLSSIKGLISAEIFSDFLEMAEHFLENGFKDASAVIIGSVLEEHLRQLADKNNIEVTTEKNGEFIPKKADRINADLASAGVYSKLDQKNVTAWLGLRNSAAHGKYDEYVLDQVKIKFAGVSDFIARHQI